jgi:endonuclease-3
MAKRAGTRKSIPKPAKTPAETRKIMLALGTQHPNADTELHYTNAYELLVATILSAQCTDERVNQVTPALFKRYPNAAALSRATTAELEPQIVSTGFFRAKSRSLLGMATEVVEAHGGEIPRTMDELVTLPGVGRKTANVVLGHALGVPGLPVDRHVLRVANRIGIAKSDDPEIVEQQLCEAMPSPEWTRTSDTLILHGRRICKPRPLCDRCVVRTDCNFYVFLTRKAGRAPRPADAKRRDSRKSLPEVASTRAAKRRDSRKSLPEVASTRAAKRRDSRKSLPDVASTRAAKRRGPH